MSAQHNWFSYTRYNKIDSNEFDSINISVAANRIRTQTTHSPVTFALYRALTAHPTQCTIVFCGSLSIQTRYHSVPVLLSQIFCWSEVFSTERTFDNLLTRWSLVFCPNLHTFDVDTVSTAIPRNTKNKLWNIWAVDVLSSLERQLAIQS